MKLYIFLNENDELLEEVRAENREEAVLKLTDSEALRLEKELADGCEFYTIDILDEKELEEQYEKSTRFNILNKKNIADPYEHITLTILNNLNNRNGIYLDNIDDDITREIVEEIKDTIIYGFNNKLAQK